MTRRKDNRAETLTCGDMLLHIWLHREYFEVLERYGGLNNAADALLQAMSDGRLPVDWADLPPAPPSSGASHCVVLINEPRYVQLLLRHGPRSPRYSLRRLLYAAVDNNWLEELGVPSGPLNIVSEDYINSLEMAIWHIQHVQQAHPQDLLYDEVVTALRHKLLQLRRERHDTQHT